MQDHQRRTSLPLHDQPLKVVIVEGEIVLDALHSIAPSLTAAAARATGHRLIEAADELSAQQR